MHPVGSAAWHDKRIAVQVGPREPRELFTWQHRCLNVLERGCYGPRREARLTAIAQHSVTCKTHYSGKGSFETATCWLNELLRVRGYCTSAVFFTLQLHGRVSFVQASSSAATFPERHCFVACVWMYRGPRVHTCPQ